MEVLPFIPQLGKVLLDLKGKYDQHLDNKNEIKELQLFIEDYNEHIPDLQKRFKQGLGENAMGTVVLNILERDIVKATNRLQQWSTDDSFFRVFNSEQRMKKLEHLHSKVMASVQKNLGIASLSTLMDVRESQTTILNSISDSNAQLKLLLNACIGSMTGTVVRVVKEEVMQAGKMSFADQKFWEEVLAAVNQREEETHYFYMDPILSELMIDPVVASNGHTYCRWTIIDNNMKKNPYDPSEDLTILVDNLTVRPRLFEEFPRQLKEFHERREKFRNKALALFSKDLLGDAAVALQYVLQWNKNDHECATALVQVREELKKIKGALLSKSYSTCDSSSEDEFDSSIIISHTGVELEGKGYQQTRHLEQPCENVEDTSPEKKEEAADYNCEAPEVLSPTIRNKPPMSPSPPRGSSSVLLGHSQESSSHISSSKMEDDYLMLRESHSQPQEEVLDPITGLALTSQSEILSPISSLEIKDEMTKDVVTPFCNSSIPCDAQSEAEFDNGETISESTSKESFIGRSSSSQDYKGKRSSSQDYKGRRPIVKGEDRLAKIVKEKDSRGSIWSHLFSTSRDYQQPRPQSLPTGSQSLPTRPSLSHWTPEPKLLRERAHSQAYQEKPLPELPTHTTTFSQGYEDYLEKPLPRLPIHTTTLNQGFQDYRDKPLPELPTNETPSQDYQHRKPKPTEPTDKTLKRQDAKPRLSAERAHSQAYQEKPLPELPTHTTTSSQGYEDYLEKPLPRLPIHTTTLNQGYQDYRDKPLPKTPTNETPSQDYQHRKLKPTEPTDKTLKRQDAKPRLSAERAYNRGYLDYREKLLPELPTDRTPSQDYQHSGSQRLPTGSQLAEKAHFIRQAYQYYQ